MLKKFTSHRLKLEIYEGKLQVYKCLLSQVRELFLRFNTVRTDGHSKRARSTLQTVSRCIMNCGLKFFMF